MRVSGPPPQFMAQARLRASGKLSDTIQVPQFGQGLLQNRLPASGRWVSLALLAAMGLGTVNQASSPARAQDAKAVAGKDPKSPVKKHATGSIQELMAARTSMVKPLAHDVRTLQALNPKQLATALYDDPQEMIKFMAHVKLIIERAKEPGAAMTLEARQLNTIIPSLYRIIATSVLPGKDQRAHYDTYDIRKEAIETLNRNYGILEPPHQRKDFAFNANELLNLVWFSALSGRHLASEIPDHQGAILEMLLQKCAENAAACKNEDVTIHPGPPAITASSDDLLSKFYMQMVPAKDQTQILIDGKEQGIKTITTMADAIVADFADPGPNSHLQWRINQFLKVTRNWQQRIPAEVFQKPGENPMETEWNKRLEPVYKRLATLKSGHPDRTAVLNFLSRLTLLQDRPEGASEIGARLTPLVTQEELLSTLVSPDDVSKELLLAFADHQATMVRVTLGKYREAIDPKAQASFDIQVMPDSPVVSWVPDAISNIIFGEQRYSEHRKSILLREQAALRQTLDGYGSAIAAATTDAVADETKLPEVVRLVNNYLSLTRNMVSIFPPNTLMEAGEVPDGPRQKWQERMIIPPLKAVLTLPVENKTRQAIISYGLRNAALSHNSQVGVLLAENARNNPKLENFADCAPKAMDLLVELAQLKGQVVTRDKFKNIVHLAPDEALATALERAVEAPLESPPSGNAPDEAVSRYNEAEKIAQKLASAPFQRTIAAKHWQAGVFKTIIREMNDPKLMDALYFDHIDGRKSKFQAYGYNNLSPAVDDLRRASVPLFQQVVQNAMDNLLQNKNPVIQRRSANTLEALSNLCLMGMNNDRFLRVVLKPEENMDKLMAHNPAQVDAQAYATMMTSFYKLIHLRASLPDKPLEKQPTLDTVEDSEKNRQIAVAYFPKVVASLEQLMAVRPDTEHRTAAIHGMTLLLATALREHKDAEELQVPYSLITRAMHTHQGGDGKRSGFIPTVTHNLVAAPDVSVEELKAILALLDETGNFATPDKPGYQTCMNFLTTDATDLFDQLLARSAKLSPKEVDAKYLNEQGISFGRFFAGREDATMEAHGLRLMNKHFIHKTDFKDVRELQHWLADGINTWPASGVIRNISLNRAAIEKTLTQTGDGLDALPLDDRNLPINQIMQTHRQFHQMIQYPANTLTKFPKTDEALAPIQSWLETEIQPKLVAVLQHQLLQQRGNTSIAKSLLEYCLPFINKDEDTVSAYIDKVKTAVSASDDPDVKAFQWASLGMFVPSDKLTDTLKTAFATADPYVVRNGIRVAVQRLVHQDMMDFGEPPPLMPGVPDPQLLNFNQDQVNQHFRQPAAPLGKYNMNMAEYITSRLKPVPDLTVRPDISLTPMRRLFANILLTVPLKQHDYFLLNQAAIALPDETADARAKRMAQYHEDVKRLEENSLAFIEDYLPPVMKVAETAGIRPESSLEEVRGASARNAKEMLARLDDQFDMPEEWLIKQRNRQYIFSDNNNQTLVSHMLIAAAVKDSLVNRLRDPRHVMEDITPVARTLAKALRPYYSSWLEYKYALMRLRVGNDYNYAPSYFDLVRDKMVKTLFISKFPGEPNQKVLAALEKDAYEHPNFKYTKGDPIPPVLVYPAGPHPINEAMAYKRFFERLRQGGNVPPLLPIVDPAKANEKDDKGQPVYDPKRAVAMLLRIDAVVNENVTARQKALFAPMFDGLREIPLTKMPGRTIEQRTDALSSLGLRYSGEQPFDAYVKAQKDQESAEKLDRMHRAGKAVD